MTGNSIPFSSEALNDSGRELLRILPACLIAAAKRSGDDSTMSAMICRVCGDWGRDCPAHRGRPDGLECHEVEEDLQLFDGDGQGAFGDDVPDDGGRLAFEFGERVFEHAPILALHVRAVR